MTVSITRCPIARRRTVNARPRTLLVYEGNESHVIKNMAATVNFSSPHKVSFCWISLPGGILWVSSYAYVMQLCPMLFIHVIPLLKLLG